MRLSVLLSVYEDIQKIVNVQRRGISDLVGNLMMQFGIEHGKELTEHRAIKNNEKSGKGNSELPECKLNMVYIQCDIA